MPRSVTRYALLMCFDEVQSLQPGRDLTRKAFVRLAQEKCPALSLSDDKVRSILRKHSAWPEPKERKAVFQLLDALTRHRKHDRTLFDAAVQLGLNFDAEVQKMLSSRSRRQDHSHALLMHRHLAESLAEGLTKNKELDDERIGSGLILLHLIALAASYEVEDLALESVAGLATDPLWPGTSAPSKEQRGAFKSISAAMAHSLKAAANLQVACSRLGYIPNTPKGAAVDASAVPWPTLWFFVCANALESGFLQTTPWNRRQGIIDHAGIWHAWNPINVYPRVVKEALSSQVLSMLIEASGHFRRHRDVLHWWLCLTQLDKQFCKGPHFRPKVWESDLDPQNNRRAMTDDPSMKQAVEWIQLFQSERQAHHIGWNERANLEGLATKLAQA